MTRTTETNFYVFERTKVQYGRPLYYAESLPRDYGGTFCEVMDWETINIWGTLQS